MKKLLALVLSAAMALSLAACGGSTTTTAAATTTTAASTAKKTDLVLATGGTSGTYYAVGNALVTVIGDKLTQSKITVTSTGASKANVQMITDNEAQLAVLQSDVLNYAHNGSGGSTMFDGAPETSGLWVAGLYNETVQIVSTKDITSLDQVKGKTICVGDIGSGTALNARQILEAYGMTFDDIKVYNGSFADGAEAMKNGQCDVLFTVAGAPTSSLTELAATYDFNMLSLSDEAIKYLNENYPFLVRDDLAANTYKCQTEDVVCVAVKAVLIAKDTVSEDAVYELLKTMFDNKTDLVNGHAKFSYLDAAAALDGSFDLHPGAEKYYKEVGALE